MYKKWVYKTWSCRCKHGLSGSYIALTKVLVGFQICHIWPRAATEKGMFLGHKFFGYLSGILKHS